MKTIEQVKAEAKEAKNVERVNAKDVDYGGVITPLRLHVPSVEFVRTWPDSMLEQLVLLAARQELQHGASSAVRAAIDTWSGKDGKGNPVERKEPVEDVWLAEACVAEVRPSKRMVKMAEDMLDGIEKGKKEMYAKYLAQAEVYGVEMPKDWQKVEKEDCLRYQQAKVRHVADLL